MVFFFQIRVHKGSHAEVQGKVQIHAVSLILCPQLSKHFAAWWLSQLIVILNYCSRLFADSWPWDPSAVSGCFQPPAHRNSYRRKDSDRSRRDFRPDWLRLPELHRETQGQRNQSALATRGQKKNNFLHADTLIPTTQQCSCVQRGKKWFVVLSGNRSQIPETHIETCCRVGSAASR